MSKRFGRQQKRKMKSFLMEAEKLLTEANSTIKLLRYNGQRNARIVEDTAKVLGKYFITLPPSMQSVASEHIGCQWNMVLRQQSMQLWSENTKDLLQETLNVLRLDIMQGVTHKDLQENVHVKFKFGDKFVGYSLNSALVNQTPPDVLIPKIADLMAEHLYNSLAEAK